MWIVRRDHVDGIQEVSQKIFEGARAKTNRGGSGSSHGFGCLLDRHGCRRDCCKPLERGGVHRSLCGPPGLSKALDQEGVKVSLISAGKYKVEGNPYETLGEEARSAIQSRVGDYYDAFVELGRSPTAV